MKDIDATRNIKAALDDYLMITKEKAGDSFYSSDIEQILKMSSDGFECVDLALKAGYSIGYREGGGDIGSERFIKNTAEAFYYLCNGSELNAPINIKANMGTIEKHEDILSKMSGDRFENESLIDDFIGEVEKDSFIDGFKCALKIIQSKGDKVFY